MSLVPYGLSRQLLFRLDPETAHDLTLAAIARTQGTPLQCAYANTPVSDPVTLAGLRFPKPAGLTPGLDKKPRWLDGLRATGFCLFEVGTG